MYEVFCVTFGYRTMSKDIDFKGFDWEELGEIWGLKLDPDLMTVDNPFADEQKLAKDIRYKLLRFESLSSNQISLVRKFVTKLTENSKDILCEYPLYKGLGEIEDNYTFCKYVSLLLESLWH